jgi:hypothetical protein
MPNKSSPAALPLDERGSFTIDEFCARHEISAPVYYRWQKEGIGPRETRFPGSRIIRISKQAEDEWLRARSNPTSAEAEQIIRDARAGRERATRARAGRGKTAAS